MENETITPDMQAARARLREKMGDSARIGGSKGGARMKRRPQVHKATGGGDDKKLQTTIRRMGLSTLPSVDEVAMLKNDGKAIVFQRPRVQAALNANTFIITGPSEEKPIEQVLTVPSDIDPEMLKKFAAEWQKMQERSAAATGGIEGAAAGANGSAEEDDEEDIPDLVTDFQAAAQAENVVSSQ